MVRIGDKEVVFQQTLLALDDQDVSLEIPVRDSVLRIRLRCVGLGAEEKQTADWKTVDGVLEIVLRGGHNPVGTALSPPERLGDIKGDPLWFQAATYRIATLNVIHFLVLLGGANA